jgi:hypothetical protein
VKDLCEVDVEEDKEGRPIRILVLLGQYVHVEGKWNVFQHYEEVSNGQGEEHKVDGRAHFLPLEDNHDEEIRNCAKDANGHGEIAVHPFIAAEIGVEVT